MFTADGGLLKKVKSENDFNLSNGVLRIYIKKREPSFLRKVDFLGVFVFPQQC